MFQGTNNTYVFGLVSPTLAEMALLSYDGQGFRLTLTLSEPSDKSIIAWHDGWLNLSYN